MAKFHEAPVGDVRRDLKYICLEECNANRDSTVVRVIEGGFAIEFRDKLRAGRSIAKLLPSAPPS